MDIPFIKFEANGNTYLLIQEEVVSKSVNLSHLSLRMTNKNYGIGADGIIILSNTYRPIPYIEVYNAEGNKINLSINGLRVVGKYLFDAKYKEKESIKIKTDFEIYEVFNSLNNIIVKVQVPNTFEEEKYIFNQKRYHLYFIPFENNQLYIINRNNVNPQYFKKILGKQLYEEFDCNVGLITPINPQSFSIITIARGAKLTQSCGTNICGAAYLLKELDYIDPSLDIEVETSGGAISLKFDNNDILYSGSTNLVCKGTFYL